MAGYLIDNNVISHFFASLFPEVGTEFVERVIDRTPNISVITKIEALSWISSDKAKEEVLKSFIRDAHIVPLSDDVVVKCISIRRMRKIKTPDAIIAATAIVHGLTLLTNDKDFFNIHGLDVINPYDL